METKIEIVGSEYIFKCGNCGKLNHGKKLCNFFSCDNCGTLHWPNKGNRKNEELSES